MLSDLPGTPTYHCSLFVSTINYHYHLFIDSLRPVGWSGVQDGNAGLAGITVTSSFQTLSVVSSSKILVFIQYIISIQCRFYGNRVQTLTTRDCKGPQTNMPKNVGSIKT